MPLALLFYRHSLVRGHKTGSNHCFLPGVYAVALITTAIGQEKVVRLSSFVHVIM